MQKIVTHLWFDTQAEEATTLYTSLFKNSKVTDVKRFGDGGSVLTATFELDGQEFMALNAGPQFKFNESISLFVKCETQEEVDRLWNALTADGGEESMCGWLKDKFGVSWQIVPTVLSDLMSDPDPVKAQRVMEVMLKMRKLDIKLLEAARDL